jgi:ligand-binding sensor domain-containing protein
MHSRFVFFLAFLPASLFAQYNWVNFVYRHNVNCMLEDSSCLWIGTSDAGLVRRNIETGDEIFFDEDNGFIGDKIIGVVKGTDNTIWAASSTALASCKNNIWSTYDLSDSQINSLTVDNDGFIWVACENKVARQNGEQFEFVSSFDSLRLTSEYPRCICTNRHDSSIYVLADTRVFCFNPDASCRSIISIPLSNPFDITVDTSGNLFVTNINTVAIYSDSAWTYFTTEDSTLPNSVSKLESSPDGSIWAFGAGNVLVFNDGSWELRHQHEMGVNLITALAPLNKDSAWVGGDFLGYLTSDSLGIITSNTPGNNNINFVYADKQGTIWTQVKGDNIIKYSDNKWDYANSTFGSLGVGTIKMMHTSQDVFYFLQSRDVMLYGSKINGVARKYIVGSGFVPSGTLYDLTEDYSGQIWFATTNGVIRNWDSTFFNKDNAWFTSNNIKTLLLKKDSTLWAGGDNGTLAYFKDSTWNPQNLSSGAYITCLAEDSSHCLWIGTTEGLVNKCSDKETLYTTSNGLGHNHINSLLVDNDNRVWVGTYDGLSCFENNSWTTFRRPCGIAGDYISSIVQNTDNVIWIGTDRGVSALHISSSATRDGKRKNSMNSKKSVYQYVTIGKKAYLNHSGNSYYLVNGAKLQVRKSGNQRNATVNSYIVKPTP